MNKPLLVLAMTALIGASSLVSAATGPDGRVIPFSEPSRDAMSSSPSRDSSNKQAESRTEKEDKQARITPFSQRTNPPMG